MRTRSFITKAVPKHMNTLGFTLVEVLISAAILGFIALPVTAGLLNAVKSANYARTAYKASLYADSLLTVFECNLRSGAENGMPEGMDENYETESFDYLVQVHNLISGEVLEYKTDERLLASVTAVVANDTLNGLYNAVNAERIIYDVENTVELQPGVPVTDIRAEAFITIANNSGAGALVRCMGEPEGIGILSAEAVTVVGLYEEQSNNAYLLHAEVWDKNGGEASAAIRVRLVLT